VPPQTLSLRFKILREVEVKKASLRVILQVATIRPIKGLPLSNTRLKEALVLYHLREMVKNPKTSAQIGNPLTSLPATYSSI
jgi:hypothetical protein